MQTREYGRALDEIIRLLQLRELQAILGSMVGTSNRNLTPSEKNGFVNAIWSLEGGYVVMQADPSLSQVAASLGVDALLDRESRTAYITQFTNFSQTNQVRTTPLFVRLYFAVASIVALSTSIQTMVLGPRNVEDPAGSESLELEIEDYDGDGIEARRVVVALESLVRLYEAVLRSTDEQHVAPVIRWIDSGSNIVLSFRGAGKAIQAIRGIFKDMWRAVRFHRNEKIERDLATASKQLDFMADIQRREAAGSLDPETAGMIRHQVAKEVTTLLGVGVMPSEVEQSGSYDRKEVLVAVRNTKLLGPGGAPEE